MSGYQDSINRTLNTIGMAYGIYSRGKAEGLKEAKNNELSMPLQPKYNNRIAKRSVAEVKEAIIKPNPNTSIEKNDNTISAENKMNRNQIKDILTTGFKAGYLKAQQAAMDQAQKTNIQNQSINEREMVLKKINDLKSSNKISGRVMRQVAYALREEKNEK